VKTRKTTRESLSLFFMKIYFWINSLFVFLVRVKVGVGLFAENSETYFKLIFREFSGKIMYLALSRLELDKRVDRY